MAASRELARGKTAFRQAGGDSGATVSEELSGAAWDRSVCESRLLVEP